MLKTNRDAGSKRSEDADAVAGTSREVGLSRR